MSASCRPIPARAKHYLFNGRAPTEGDVIRLPALAATLKTIAAKGARAFYEGAIAEDMARDASPRAARSSTAEDFARHRGDAVDADLDQLSRPRRSRNSAERAGPHRAGDAQHPRELRPRSRSIRSGPERFHLVLEAARLGLCRARHAYRRCRCTCARRSPRCSTRTLREEACRHDRSRASAPTCRPRRRPAATRSISPWSIATAWRCRSSIRSIRASASASAPRRPASC